MALKFNNYAIQQSAERIRATFASDTAYVLLYPASVPFPSGQVTSLPSGNLIQWTPLTWTVSDKTVYLSGGTTTVNGVASGTAAWALIRIGAGNTYLIATDSLSTSPGEMVQVSSLSITSGQPATLLGVSLTIGAL